VLFRSVEHNISAIMHICDRMIFMDAGTVVCQGTPERVRNDPRVMEAYLGR
jgi:ABC-type branched-subunit amino acid transport system ATPase component